MDYVLGEIYVFLISGYSKDMPLKKSIFLIPVPMRHFVNFGLGHSPPCHKQKSDKLWAKTAFNKTNSEVLKFQKPQGGKPVIVRSHISYTILIMIYNSYNDIIISLLLNFPVFSRFSYPKSSCPAWGWVMKLKGVCWSKRGLVSFCVFPRLKTNLVLQLG